MNHLFAMEQLSDTVYSVDLSERSKFTKLIYYIFINRAPLKEKIKNRLKNHETIYSISKGSYNLIRKTKNVYNRKRNKKSDL